MVRPLRVLALFSALAFLAGPAAAADKSARLEALYEQYWEEYLELNPLAAGIQTPFEKGEPAYCLKDMNRPPILPPAS